jgi:hypothetical protein
MSVNITITLDDYEILGLGPESRGSARASILLKCVGNATAIGDTGTFLSPKPLKRLKRHRSVLVVVFRANS